MPWNYIKDDELPEFNQEVHLFVLGDKTQNPRPKILDRGQLTCINANGPIFEQWDTYLDRFVEVSGLVVAWHEFPELPEI